MIPPTSPSSPPTALYFAEGSTLDGFQEYLLLANAGASSVPAVINYYFDDGSPTMTQTVSVPSVGRATVDVPAFAGRGHTGVSAKVTAPSPVVAERSMYFAHSFPIGDVNGSHAVLGGRPSKSWTFAEGSTLDGLQEYFIVENPGGATANASFSFGVEEGTTISTTISVPAGQRRTLDANAVLGAVVGHSTFVSSDQDILVERPMYFRRAVGDDGAVINGGHVSFGSDAGHAWRFAEGTVLADFFTYVTVANPSALTATADIAYFFSSGESVTRTATVLPHSRHTVRVFDAADPAGVGRDVSDPVSRGVAIDVTSRSAAGIVVERPEYFHHDFFGTGEIDDGHVQAGVPTLSTRWSFAEGSTLPGFAPFLTVLNRGDTDAALTLTYALDDGLPVVRTVNVGPTSRLTIQMYGPPQEGGVGSTYTGFGVFVTANQSVLVESPIYVRRTLVPELPEIVGGADVVGLPG